MIQAEQTQYTPETSDVILARKIRTSETITPESIKAAFDEWDRYATRYQKLFKYYIGEHPKPEDMHGDPVVSNICYYIVSAIKGYMIGNRPTYDCAPGDTEAQEIIDLFNKQRKYKTDAEIVEDLSIFGDCVELVYLSTDSKGHTVPKSAEFSPADAFVAYAGDVESDSVFGAVRYVEKAATPGTPDTYRLYVYTREDVQVWESTGKSGPWTMTGAPVPHGFGRVPLIEYTNNKARMGDFEQIISLQNAYNRLLTDRMEDKDAWVRSILMIQGQVIGKTADEVEASVKSLNKNRVLQLDDDASAAYLEKNMDESGAQIQQDQYGSDIHKLAMVPDLSDEQFAGNASGVAMAYKLFGTDQRVAEKITNIQDGFMRRCKLYDFAMHNPTRNPSYMPRAAIEDMKITFKLNAPQDLAYMSTALTTLINSGVISKATARANLSIIADPEREKELIDAERKEDAEYNRQMFEQTAPFMDSGDDDSDTDSRDPDKEDAETAEDYGKDPKKDAKKDKDE